MRRAMKVNPKFERIWRNTRRIQTDAASGSGCMVRYDDDVLLVTNAHVVDGFKDVLCEDLSQETSVCRLARLFAIDYAHDIAILRLIPHPGDMIAEGLEIGQCSQPGDFVSICGFPLGSKTARLSSGIISGFDEIPLEGHLVSSLVVQAPVNKGNSGGPVCDEDGLLTGIVYAMNPRLQNIKRPTAPTARAAIQYMEDAMIPVDGFGYVLDPSEIENMMQSFSYINNLGPDRTKFAPRTVPFPRQAFVNLQKQIADYDADLPANMSCIGPFNIFDGRIWLGFHGEDQIELDPPEEWLELCRKYLREYHFYLKGYTVVAYHKKPRYSSGIWVDKIELKIA